MYYELVNASLKDIEKLIRYKENNIFQYVDTKDKDEILRIQKYVLEHINKQIELYKVIIVDGEIVGSLLVEDKDDGVILDEIYLEEDYRNKGIGTKIIKQVLLGNKIVYLWVYQKNKKAIKLYKSLGFKVIQETESRYYMRYKKDNKVVNNNE